MIAYLKLLIYSCLCGIIICGLLGLSASVIFYFKNGQFIIPEGQIIRGIVFGCIAGTAITATAIVFKLIDYFGVRKSPPSDSD